MAEEMTALIFGACPCSDWGFLQEICPDPDLVIAADGGIHQARAAGYEPDFLVGDWDSGGAPEEGIPSWSLPAEKDLTDLQAALELCLERGVRKAVLTACLGGRLDQTMANLGLLEWFSDRGGEALALEPGNEARFWDGRELFLPREERYRFVSIIPLDGTVTGVTLEGVKYPLKEATIHRGDTLTISNEITAPQAHFRAKKGRMLVIRSQKIR